MCSLVGPLRAVAWWFGGFLPGMLPRQRRANASSRFVLKPFSVVIWWLPLQDDTMPTRRQHLSIGVFVSPPQGYNLVGFLSRIFASSPQGYNLGGFFSRVTLRPRPQSSRSLYGCVVSWLQACSSRALKRKSLAASGTGCSTRCGNARPFHRRWWRCSRFSTSNATIVVAERTNNQYHLMYLSLLDS
jgi:hypothetical protein